ncbi:MAG: DUF2335 domain-containing protein [Deltaproteobacteria bacterium]|nr:DUF2335 domain-containing protein [Deltaproteobacteria bacterium]
MPKPHKPKNRDLPSKNPSPLQEVRQVAFSRSAPFPHPSELEKYEQILPGSAERIFSLVENQSNHRQGLENKALSMESRNSLLGVLVGGFIGIVGISIAGFCVYTGHDQAGMALGGGTLVALVGPFIYGTRERRIEREQKYLIGQSPRKNQR